MSTATLPKHSDRILLGRRLMGALMVAVAIAGNVGRARSRPALSHVRDHGYSICAFGFISAAAFTHSVFAGLLVTGISFFVYEWKVADDGANS